MARNLLLVLDDTERVADANGNKRAAACERAYR